MGIDDEAIVVNAFGDIQNADKIWNRQFALMPKTKVYKISTNNELEVTPATLNDVSENQWVLITSGFMKMNEIYILEDY